MRTAGAQRAETAVVCKAPAGAQQAETAVVCKARWQAVSWHWELGLWAGTTHHSDEEARCTGTGRKQCASRPTPAFVLGAPEFWNTPEGRCPPAQPPAKALVTKCDEPPGYTDVTGVLTTLC